MRLNYRNQSIKAAISAVLLGVGLGLSGCDALQGSNAQADRKAVEAMKRGDYQAAANEKSTSPIMTTFAASIAGTQQYALAVPVSGKLTEAQITISQLLSRIDRLTGSVRELVDSGKSLNSFDPKDSLATIDTTIKAVNGQADAPSWSPTDMQAVIPTLQASTAAAMKLKDGIAEIQRHLGELKQKREASAADADRLANESKAATGQKSVDLFRDSANAKKQASDLDVQIEQAQASLVPLQQDLSMADDQARLATGMIAAMTDQGVLLNKSWRGIQAQIEVRKGFALDVYGRGTRNKDKDDGSILAKSQQLAELLGEQEKQTQAFQTPMESAVKLATESASAAKKAWEAVQTLQRSGASPNKATADAWKLTQTAIDPSGARLNQGMMQLSAARRQAMLASEYSIRIRTAHSVNATAALLGQKAPEGFDAAALKATQDELIKDAQAKLASAADTIGTVADALPTIASQDTKDAATVGRMLALHAEASLASDIGDNQAAKQYLDEAKALRDPLREKGFRLPSLPDALQGASVPAPLPASLPAETK